MKQKIIDWYSERHYHPQKVIKVGRKHGRSKAQVMAAMEHCYHKIQAGKDIPAIDIARYIFNVARDIDCSEYEKHIKEAVNANETIKGLKENLDKSVKKHRSSKIRIVRKLKAVSDKKVKEVKNTSYACMAFTGLINVLAWLFLLNWR